MSSSVENQNPWATYDTYKDCSQGICSIYCPQWCYIIFPPPPPSFDLGDDVSSTDFSPLIIAIIGILASAFILLSYYTIISKYCRRRGGRSGDTNMEFNENGDQSSNDQTWNRNRSGLDEAIIKTITVCKYKKGDGFIDGTDCSVCLSEFEENESLRLLPKCSHAFHLPCIDTWLKSHATCPLCRAMILPPPSLPPPQQQQETSPTPPQLSTHEYQHRVGETVIVVHQDLESNTVSEETVNDSMQEPQPVRRSMSLNLSQINEAHVSISDILQISEEAAERGKRGKIMTLVGSSLTMKRSVSTGRVMLSSRDQDKGKNSVAITIDSFCPNLNPGL